MASELQDLKCLHVGVAGAVVSVAIMAGVAGVAAAVMTGVVAVAVMTGVAVTGVVDVAEEDVEAGAAEGAVEEINQVSHETWSPKACRKTAVPRSNYSRLASSMFVTDLVLICLSQFISCPPRIRLAHSYSALR